MAGAMKNISDLKRLQILQDKLRARLDNNQENSDNDETVSHCCDAIEFNSNIQTQLYYILGLMTRKGLNGPPGLEKSLPGRQVRVEGKEQDQQTIKGGTQGQKRTPRFDDEYEIILRELEDAIHETHNNIDKFQHSLKTTGNELTSVRQKTQDEMHLAEKEIKEMADKFRLLERGLSSIKYGEISSNRIEIPNDNVDQPLPNNQSLLKEDRTGTGLTDCIRSDARKRRGKDSAWRRLKEKHLIERYQELKDIDRQTTITTLKTKADDSQRLIYAIMQESFRSAKKAFAIYKAKVRSITERMRPDSKAIDEAVQEYIDRNPDDCCLSRLTSEVMRATVGPPISTCAFSVQPFVEEACKLAWNMQTLPVPMDILDTDPCELFDATRYNRQSHSNYSSTIVDRYVWPCLVQGPVVLVKGEAITR